MADGFAKDLTVIVPGRLATRSSQCSLQRPSSREAIAKRISPKTEPVGPLSKAHRLTVKSQQSASSSIPGLRLSGSPPAIVLVIVAFVVDPINRMLRRRARSHVLIERRERISPSLADSDSASAVVDELLSLWVVTPLNHVGPRIVFGALVHAVTLARATRAFLGAMAIKRGPKNNPLVSAFTPAQPSGLIARCQSSERENRPFSKHLTRQVDDAIWNGVRIGIAHQTNLLHRFGWWKALA